VSPARAQELTSCHSAKSHKPSRSVDTMCGYTKTQAFQLQLLADGLGFWHATRSQDLAAAEVQHLCQRHRHTLQVIDD
jgi:hypothetical protein